MNDYTSSNQRAILKELAHKAMLERGLLPEFSKEVMYEVQNLNTNVNNRCSNLKDLRALPWCSIDNDDSLDLDQLSVLVNNTDGTVSILVAIADVDFYVTRHSALDKHARHNASTVYTASKIFSMLPEELSTNLSSLNFNEDRVALIMEITLNSSGDIINESIYRALVCNKARLDYDVVSAWLERTIEIPSNIKAVPELEENLRLQDAYALLLKKKRAERGSLDFESKEFYPLFEADSVKRLELSKKNRAKEMIENFMVAANGVVARFLAHHNFPSLARVVRTPKRWDRILTIAKEKGFELPVNPDSKALSNFLSLSKKNSPETYSELSLTIIKLLGAGEYVATIPGKLGEGHFGLAVKEYAHSTAPNRRYPDLITHRLLKAILNNEKCPYTLEELVELGKHCTNQENEVNKVERQVLKSAAALLFTTRIGDAFDAIITGAAEKGTWVKLKDVPIEGHLNTGRNGLDIGDKIKVTLISVDVEKGFIDFEPYK